ncbi:alanine--tRNA ligase [Leucothrix pacifica]|uniref:Alanine--tRNA ligase n=1 Tax=Leucothrix pacifica TaxID=1247513 RepID=A0A317C191_9GAMM|nr:alanine--tRNA ligase [Leucothrix pacifica]PWQ92416.1 alanine--tRNA ligase [Leucothrix pacifica]
MQRNSTAEVRQQFLDFFASKGHEIVPSSSLIPGNDKTLLFTNAGMVQFKDVFTGDETRPYTRATTSQRCVRAGGKHNDLENVGYTARHHTFFEMLGNFSFGDYFKKDAIHNAWEFLTEVLELPKEKLWVTVYEEDEEAANIWIDDIGFPADRISRIGDKPGKRYESDNFWAMGDTGPCGPCSEIFYDHGEEIWGGPPGTPEEDGDRFIEIWNLVFMQYERFPDGTMKPLPKPSIDTGMGLERLCAILQNGHSNYDIDLFQYLIKHIAEMSGTEDLDNASLKVIADHIRSCSFLILDGVVPSNEGRGYVLRRIIRRAARHGHKLGLEGAFFNKLVPPLVDQMGAAYPDLAEAQASIESTLLKEEVRFGETLDKGMKLLDEAIADLSDDVLPGAVMFKLYDTFGFPVDLTADIVRERGLQIDEAGFDVAMNEQREKARAAGKFGTDYTAKLEVEGETDFTGYDAVYSDQSEVVGIFVEGEAVDKIAAGQSAQVVLDTTPFYAESGGQIGDSGYLTSASANFEVADTQKQGDVFIHQGELSEGTLSVGDKLAAHVDASRRQAIVLNHSGTHLMHKAMRDVLGDHVEQKGSLVTEERLRFDFSHSEPVTPEQIAEIENIVNAEIRKNAATEAEITSMERALEKGAMALFGEKYGDEVRVLTIGFSTELCGGVHVERTGDIGLFKIVSEGGVAAGVRRVEAMTGAGALAWMDAREAELATIAKSVKASIPDASGKVQQLVDKNRQLEKELDQLKSKLAAQAGSDLVSQAVDVGGIKVLAANLEGADPKSLRDTADQLKNKLGQAAVVVATVNGDKVSLVAAVTKAESATIKAGELLGHVAKQIDGKGGGRPDMAQGGGNNPAALPAALDSVVNWVKERV